MKEPFNGYLAKLVRKVEDPMTHLSSERATAPTEMGDDSQKSHCRTQQGKGCNHVSNAVRKTKKYRIPFVALALVLLLAFPCFISLSRLRPVAFADLDVSPMYFHVSEF